MKHLRPFEQRGTTILSRLKHTQAPQVAEIGVLRAHTTEFILRNRKDLHVIMVDSWAVQANQPDRYKATGDDHAFHDGARVRAHFHEAMERTRPFAARVEVLVLPSVQAAGLVDPRSLDLVFIDADHSYEGVREDIEAWLPKVKTGGWIGGHDYANNDPAFQFGVTAAVDDWCRESGNTIETDLNFTWWARV